MTTKYFTLLAQIAYQGPAGLTNCIKTCTISNFSCEFAQYDPEDENCIWEQTLWDLFFHRLKMDELKDFLVHSQKDYPKGKIGICEEADQFKRLNQCEDLVELYRVRFNATDIIITVLEHKVDITNGCTSVPETEVLLEDYHNNLKPLY